jgi:lipoprotein-anchoring transpeptidase ErfK/SrfK
MRLSRLFVVVAVFAAAILLTVTCAVPRAMAQTVAAEDETSWPNDPEPTVVLPPDAPVPNAPPLKPLPRKGRPVKPAVVVAPEPPPKLPPPTPRFNPDAPAALTLVYPAPGGMVNEGGQTLVWNTSGPIAQVKLVYSGDRCELGGSSRGSFSETIGKFANKGVTQWSVPWMDASDFKVRVVGYDSDGKEVASDEKPYQLRPRFLEGKPEHCIVVSKARQRLYYLVNGAIKRMHLVSTAASGFNTPSMRPGSYGSRGAMGRVFSKQFAPVSHLYHVTMYYWLGITSSGSHGIHATSPPFYGRLGGPASHGCIRQHRADARVLWEMVQVGTPVYVQ